MEILLQFLEGPIPFVDNLLQLFDGYHQYGDFHYGL